MNAKMGDVARILHIIDACEELLSYTADSSKSDFETNSMMRFACIKQLEIIGEAANHVSAATQSRFNEIQWRQIVGMRNIFVHEYFGVDTALVWDIIQNNIPSLLKSAKHIQSEL